MSYYVCSDIHGRFDRYQKLLDQIQLTSDDRLFILLNLTHKFMWISYCFYAILKKKR